MSYFAKNKNSNGKKNKLRDEHDNFFMIDTLGILQTDDVQPEWRKQFGNYPAMFKALFKRVAPTLKYKIYDVTRLEHPHSLGECDAYLITGSRAGAYEERQWIGELKQLIRALSEQRIPLAGICFGHQVIAAAFHAPVVKSKSGWGIGVHEYRLNQPLEGFAPQEKFKLIATHQDQVIQTPAAAQVLASSSFCPVAALISREKNFITFQGHPEFTKEYFIHLLNNRLKKIDESRREEALGSMNEEPMSANIAAVIIDFLSFCREAADTAKAS